MSIEAGPAGSSRRSRARARRTRGFFAAFALVMAALIAVVVTGAALSLSQGPRLTGVQVDPAAAAAASGSRMILTANQALDSVTADQVSVEPDVPFTVDASGRSVGVRFTVPLWDDTEYTVTVSDVEAVGGGPTADLTSSFRTPAAEVFLLQRSTSGDDAIFRTDLTGERAVPVFTHPHIEDFRASGDRLVVSVVEDDASVVLVTDLAGENRRELGLPGDGIITALQVSGRGDLVGYTYSDRALDEDSGRESVIFTQSLRQADAEPQPLEIAGEAPSVVDWLFVPEATAALLIDFAGDLLLTDPATDGDPTALGAALTIDGITVGTFQAVVERIDGLRVLDLTDAGEEPLVPAEGEESLGVAGSVTPIPGGGTVRLYSERDAAGLPVEQSVVHVSDEGAVLPLLEVPISDGVLQTCVAPSGRYAAALVAPDLVSNPYDGYLQPLPQNLETHIIELSTGDEVVTLAGSAISWCAVGAS
ncbi:Ig-like domain-containing protein [Microbacterium sp. DT81.1]|uniref:Ig-like domain-containing protein n=1 Tax=Microbacterium sp. DT81.1 TaxID=3393413 RepID=UPI003CEFC057